MPVPTAELLDPWCARLRVVPEPGAPRQHEVVVVLSPAFPPYTVVDLPDDRRPPGWQVAVRADVEGGRVHAVEVMEPEAASLWYVELSEPDAEPPASTLVAFSDLRYAEGTLLDADRASRGDVTGARQVGALRWWPGTGLVHQLYVGAEHRRRGVGRKLVQAAFGLQLARGLPPLHGDGRRTDLGEEWRRSLPEAIAARLAPWSHRMAPMTPPA